MADKLSQEEIEQLLMKGVLPEEKSKELLKETTNEKSNEPQNQKEVNEVLNGKEDKSQITEEKTIEKISFITNIKEKMQNKKIQKAEKKEAIKKEKAEKSVTSKPKEAEETQIPSVENSIIPKENSAIVERINNAPTKTLYIILAILSVLVIIMSGLLIMQLNKKNQLDTVNKKTVTVPNYKANTTNYIFINQEKVFNNTSLKLVKMLIDPVATVFYFDKPLDFMLYEANLKDKNNKSYNMDISFAEANNSKDTELAVLRFAPLDEGVKEFKLSISDMNSDTRVDYTIALNSYPKVLPPKYLPAPIKTNNTNSDIELVLEDAIFSSSGSIIEYRLNWKDNSTDIRLGWKDVPYSELVIIEERGNKIKPTKNYPTMYSFPNNNTILGRMDFAPIKNLNSDIDVKFKNIYIQENLNQRIDLTNMLFSSARNKQKEIVLDNYKIVLENFANLGDNYIIVYHAEDLSKPEADNLIEAKLEAELIIGDGSGMEVVIDGKCMSKQEGGDFIFNTKNAIEIINNLKNKQYTLNLKNVGIRLPDQTVSLQLPELDITTKQMDKNEVESFVIEAFEKRLSVKSSEIDVYELKNYFKTSVLENEIIIRDYLQPETLTEPAEYSSQILTIGKNDDGTYFVVVQDAWKGNTGIKEVHFYRTHKIVVQNINGEYIITEDNIVK